MLSHAVRERRRNAFSIQNLEFRAQTGRTWRYCCPCCILCCGLGHPPLPPSCNGRSTHTRTQTTKKVAPSGHDSLESRPPALDVEPPVICMYHERKRWLAVPPPPHWKPTNDVIFATFRLFDASTYQQTRVDDGFLQIYYTETFNFAPSFDATRYRETSLIIDR